jgi:hypothetical protein
LSNPLIILRLQRRGYGDRIDMGIREFIIKKINKNLPILSISVSPKYAIGKLPI